MCPCEALSRARQSTCQCESHGKIRQKSGDSSEMALLQAIPVAATTTGDMEVPCLSQQILAGPQMHDVWMDLGLRLQESRHRPKSSTQRRRSSKPDRQSRISGLSPGTRLRREVERDRQGLRSKFVQAVNDSFVPYWKREEPLPIGERRAQVRGEDQWQEQPRTRATWRDENRQPSATQGYRIGEAKNPGPLDKTVPRVRSTNSATCT